MIRNIFKSLFFLFAIINANALFAQPEVTLEDIFMSNKFAVKSIPGFNALNNGQEYTQLDRTDNGQEINVYSLADGKKIRTLYTHKNKENPISHYTLSNDETKIMLFSNPEYIYRHSATYKTEVYLLEYNNYIGLHSEGVLHAQFDPRGDKVAFVYKNNLMMLDMVTGDIKEITKDGKQNEIINGNCDWVYEEEFGFTQAYEWSPDGKHIAFYRFDESKVKEFTMMYYDEKNNYPTPYTFKYPKAGEDNSIVEIKLYEIATGRTTKADIGSETDQYIPRIKWAKNNELCIYRLNRLQNKLELLLTNASTGKSQIIYTEENKYYIDINDNISFLSGENAFVFTSEQGGFNHCYKWDWSKKSLQQITKGKWDVDNLIGFDEKAGLLYYTAGVNSPLERKMYSVNIKNSKTNTLTPQSGMSSITPCKGFQYFLVKYSDVANVPVYSLIDKNGKTVRVLEDNNKLKQTLSEYKWGKTEFLTIPNNEGVQLNGYMITPPNFDKTKKYPVFMYQYSGPGSQQVYNQFMTGNYFWHQYLALKGYIIVCVDGTGTGARGEEFKKKTYLQLGNLESNDQIAVAQYLAKQSYVDEKRIGIWGWSYGGFMSATCIFKAPDVFKAAISVAPVTNWRLYDNIYTERYMRTPQENPDGYDNNAPEKMAKNLKGNFLLIHGMADDNVHFQNAVILTDNLIKAGKQFRSEYYPNKNHGIGGGNTRYQLYQRMTEFVLEEL